MFCIFKVVMITGDNPMTACHVARELRFTQRTTLVLTKDAENPDLWFWESIDGLTKVDIEGSTNTKAFVSKYDLCLTGEVSATISKILVWLKSWARGLIFCLGDREVIRQKCNLTYSVFARSPLFSPQTPFSRSLRSTIGNPGHPHSMRTLWIANGGPERAKNGVWGRERRDRATSESLSQNSLTLLGLP